MAVIKQGLTCGSISVRRIYPSVIPTQSNPLPAHVGSFMQQLDLPFLSVIAPEAKLLARRLMILDGLLPTVDAHPEEIQEALSKMSSEARRATTRRFRKAWRRARANQLIELRDSVGPSQKDKQELVLRWYLEKAQKMVECG